MQLAFTTVDEFHGLLEQAGEALDYREVWPRLFPVANCPPSSCASWSTTSSRATSASPGRATCTSGWRRGGRTAATSPTSPSPSSTSRPRAPRPASARSPRSAPCGSRADGRSTAFSALVNPGMPIPAMITGITGIDDETVAGAPPIEVVLPRFVDFAAHSVLVAHNAPFDLGFLDYELGRQRGQTFPRPALDTLRLARKLCPQQRCSLERPRLPLRHPGQAGAPRPARRTGHRRAAPAVPLLAAGAGHEHPRGGRALLPAGHAAQLPQDLADGEAPDGARRLPHEGRQGGAAVHRQGREPAAPHARPLPAAAGVPRPAGAGAPRADRRHRDRLGVRRAPAREPAHRAGTGRRTTRTAPRSAPTTTSSSAPRSTHACTPRPTCATTARTTPGRSASPAWPGASSTASTAPTRCAPARTCRATAAGTPASAPAPAPASRRAAGP